MQMRWGGERKSESCQKQMITNRLKQNKTDATIVDTNTEIIQLYNAE